MRHFDKPLTFLAFHFLNRLEVFLSPALALFPTLSVSLIIKYQRKPNYI